MDVNPLTFAVLTTYRGGASERGNNWSVRPSIPPHPEIGRTGWEFLLPRSPQGGEPRSHCRSVLVMEETFLSLCCQVL